MILYQIHIIYLSITIILMFCLLSPNIVYLIHKKWFIWKNTEEWGYLTPKQYRYPIKTIVCLLDSDIKYKILETSRYDYLICRIDGEGDYKIVRQDEIRLA